MNNFEEDFKKFMVLVGSEIVEKLEDEGLLDELGLERKKEDCCCETPCYEELKKEVVDYHMSEKEDHIIDPLTTPGSASAIEKFYKEQIKDDYPKISHPSIRTYYNKDFLDLILGLGKEGAYPWDKYLFEEKEKIIDSVRSKIMSYFNLPTVIIREEDHCLAIAIPQYISDAKFEFSLALKLIPDCFTEVSGPGSTVIIIDCQKIFFKSEFFEIGAEEWLL